MFNMEQFNRELDEQNAALESLLAELETSDIADEALLSNPDCVDDMLEKVKAQVEKCETADDCKKLSDGLNTEIEKFNGFLDDMKEACKKYADDASALKDAISPAIAGLKKACNIISLKDMEDETDTITDDEIKKLRDFLTGAKELIDAKCEELCDGECDDDEPAEEGKCKKGACEAFFNSLEPSELEIAQESLIDAVIKMQTALADLCKRLANKCKQKMDASKEDSKMEAFWSKLYSFFRSKAAKLDVKIAINDEKAAAKQKEKLEKEKAEIEAKQKEMTQSESAIDRTSAVATEAALLPYNNMVDAAFEAYDLAKAEYDAALESATIAQESAEIAASVGCLAAYAGLIALLVKASNGNDIKYIKNLNNEYKPKIKQIKSALKAAKKAREYDKAIKFSKDLIVIYKKMEKDVSGIGQEIKSNYKKVKSNGETSKEVYTYYGPQAEQTLKSLRNEIQKLETQIKVFEQEKKKVANESAVDDAYMEGYMKAYEQLICGDMDDEDEE